MGGSRVSENRAESAVQNCVYPVSADWAKRAYIDDAKYKEVYARSVSDPDGFWGDQAKRIGWMKAPTRIESPSRPAISRSNGSRTAF